MHAYTYSVIHGHTNKGAAVHFYQVLVLSLLSMDVSLRLAEFTFNVPMSQFKPSVTHF